MFNLLYNGVVYKMNESSFISFIYTYIHIYECVISYICLIYCIMEWCLRWTSHHSYHLYMHIYIHSYIWLHDIKKTFYVICNGVVSKMNKSSFISFIYTCIYIYHTFEQVRSYTWMSHVPRTNGSSHTHECGGTHVKESDPNWMSHGTHMNESRHTYEWVMSHMWMSRVTYVNATARMWRSHGTHMNESRHTYE